MKGSVSDRYRRWFRYEIDSHVKVIESLKEAFERHGGDIGFQKAVDLMAHILAARSLWLHRLGSAATAPTDIFPREVDFGGLRTMAEETHSRWTEYLAGLTDDGLNRVFEYRSLEGPRFTNVVEDILAQLFGHSWYHRGQIAALLRAMGATPPVTDFVFWTREPLD